MAATRLEQRMITAAAVFAVLIVSTAPVRAQQNSLPQLRRQARPRNSWWTASLFWS